MGLGSMRRAAGRRAACSHCGSTEFDESQAQLNTAGLTFLDFDWANRSATVPACRQCGHIERFLSRITGFPPERKKRRNRSFSSFNRAYNTINSV
ncbi:hypothetical protein H7313_01860 [Gordonibacter massiliensis]|uniref:Uncharacterized protein n=2 Tax=Gordonibacter massiliensis (ex Traore et al. 2017) TaxID=1841863 RepID=A0A842JDN2_9ACTN|nr:hypothetical protein [Gordonibacter massiliensis (ex Traore et al. 2017)]